MPKVTFGQPLSWRVALVFLIGGLPSPARAGRRAGTLDDQPTMGEP